MTDYQRGFLEGLQAAVIMGEGKQSAYMANAEKWKDKPDGEFAMESACTIGMYVSDLKKLAASVHRGQMDPAKIAGGNGRPYWWATEDGKGRS